MELDPSHLPARENLAGILASQGRFVDSEHHYRLAIEQDPEDAETRYLLAVVLAARADIDSALDQLERALQLKPDFERAIILRDELEARRQP